MNINNDNSRLMTHDLLQIFNNFFNENKETYKCKEFISFDSLLKITKKIIATIEIKIEVFLKYKVILSRTIFHCLFYLL